MHSFPPNSKKGFTLIEVLMAVFIGAVALAIVNVSFFRSHRAIEAVSAQRQAYQAVRIVMDRMIKDLTCSYVPWPGEPGSDGERRMSAEEISLYRFVGTKEEQGDVRKDTVRFTTVTDLGLPGSMGGACEVGYYLKEMDEVKNRYVLIRAEDPFPHYGISELPREMEVAEDIVSMEIAYVGHDGQETDSWDLDRTLRLPKEVKVTVTFEVEGEKLSFTGVAFLPLSHIELKKDGEDA